MALLVAATVVTAVSRDSSSSSSREVVIGRAERIRAESLRRTTPRLPQFLVLAPDDDDQPYALKKTKLNVVVHYYDTKCSSTNGPLSVFDYYISGQVDVFFGPSCPYVLAPVIRYASEWGLPLLTAAGQNEHFDTKSIYYRLLTRMNGSFSSLGQVFVEVMRQFDWTVVALLFHQYRDNSKGHTDCYFSLSSVFTALGKNATHHSFDEHEDFGDIRSMLEKISQKARRSGRRWALRTECAVGQRLTPFNVSPTQCCIELGENGLPVLTVSPATFLSSGHGGNKPPRAFVSRLRIDPVLTAEKAGERKGVGLIVSSPPLLVFPPQCVLFPTASTERRAHDDGKSVEILLSEAPVRPSKSLRSTEWSFLSASPDPPPPPQLVAAVALERRAGGCRGGPSPTSLKCGQFQ
ncbi:hypothetical protein HPB49_021430 [Dermacentor silvarum]|uniref:Uncharacterized protein n=1 Tax=Dermacentor silvarum TaxID=543639 RepID=A0ACB8CMW9_DERSI|nr:hypothetical protein HPB49_021430 [Dermacentor silvarum]